MLIDCNPVLSLLLTIIDHIVMAIASHVGVLHQRVAKAKGGRGEGIGHGGIHLGIVVLIEARAEQLQIEELTHLCAQYDGQELTVCDVLEHGAHNAPRFLVQLLVAPVRIHFAQFHGNAIVLAHPHVMHGQQAGLLAATTIAGTDALRRNCAALAHILGGIAASVDQQSIAKDPRIVRRLGAVRVDRRGIYVGCGLVGLLAPRQHTVATLSGRRAQELQAAYLERRQPGIV